jgi:hypothetical protein
MPQEIGAEATRDKKSDNWDPFVGTFQKYARIKALSATPQPAQVKEGVQS